MKPVALFANLLAASSVLVRWPISGASDRGSLTVAIKTHAWRRVHGRTRAYTWCRVLPLTVHLLFLLLHGVCLDLTPHLLRTIRKTHTHRHTHSCAHRHTHTHLHFPPLKNARLPDPSQPTSCPHLFFSPPTSSSTLHPLPNLSASSSSSSSASSSVFNLHPFVIPTLFSVPSLQPLPPFKLSSLVRLSTSHLSGSFHLPLI